ncbi:MAG: FecR family protein [Gemmatimonas sp.]
MSRPHDAGAEAPMNPELSSMLEARPDARELHAVYRAVPVTRAPLSAAQHEAAWKRLQNRLQDPARAPYVDDARAPLELVRDDRADGRVPEARHPEDTSVPPTGVRPTASPRGRWGRWAAAAAVVGMLVGGGGWATGSVTHQVPAGGAPRAVTLAEGSTVWMAAGSELSVPRRLGWPAVLATSTRDVRLTGEAFFIVQRDGRRFTVHTADAQVQVLGTQFAVRREAAGGVTRVDVSEGRVAVVAGAQRAELGAGEGVTVGARTWLRRSVTPTRVATWRTGGLAAFDEPLGDVLVELGRRYGVRIEHDANVDVATTVSLVYASAPSVDVVLGDLCTAEGLVFERTSRGYRITRP